MVPFYLNLTLAIKLVVSSCATKRDKTNGKTVAERKAEQRKRQKELGVTKIELLVDNQELEMLKRNCVLRMPGSELYDVVEYFRCLFVKMMLSIKGKLRSYLNVSVSVVVRNNLLNQVMRTIMKTRLVCAITG